MLRFGQIAPLGEQLGEVPPREADIRVRLAELCPAPSKRVTVERLRLGVLALT